MKNIVLLIFFACEMNNMLISQKVIPLYKDSIPNSRPSKDEEKSELHNGIMIISKISRPTLTIFLPAKEKANGTAVVICPGGGYWVNASSHEGTDVAKEFTAMGVAAFVLKYRIPDDATMINREIGPLQDAQQALKVVRDRAKEWNVNPGRIGIMGFSAGGHLASTAGTHFNKVVIPNPENTSVRPDFMILIYPVISFNEMIGHKGSAEQIIGKNPSPEKIKEYSNELQVTDQTPTTFLVHASDDDGVNPKNSIVFYEALLQHKVPAEMHIYESGGHGFGMKQKNKNELWMERCRHWMELKGWMKIIDN
ncbi:MAG: alpha/beta hydrolase [Ferruginibacter sp.]